MRYQMKYFMRGRWHSEYPTHYITAVKQANKMEEVNLPINSIWIVDTYTGEIVYEKDLSD